MKIKLLCAVGCITLLSITMPGANALPQTPTPHSSVSLPVDTRIFPDHWANQELDRIRERVLNRKSLRVSYEDVVGPTYTRDEFAALVIRELNTWDKVDRLEKEATAYPRFRLSVRRLIREFGPELGRQGVDVAALEKRLMKVERFGFSDVPHEHWAYPSVERLRAVGIIQGYPDGSF